MNVGEHCPRCEGPLEFGRVQGGDALSWVDDDAGWLKKSFGGDKVSTAKWWDTPRVEGGRCRRCGLILLDGNPDERPEGEDAPVER